MKGSHTVHILLAAAAVGGSSLVAFVAGMTYSTAHTMSVAIAQGWTPPATTTPSKSENPFRRSRAERERGE